MNSRVSALITGYELLCTHTSYVFFILYSELSRKEKNKTRGHYSIANFFLE